MRENEREREKQRESFFVILLRRSLCLHSSGLASDSNQCLRCPHQPACL